MKHFFFHMIKLCSTLGMPIKVSNYIFGTSCQWHPSSSKVASVKLVAWDQIFGHYGVEYHKLYIFPKNLLKIFSAIPYHLSFESFPLFYIILDFEKKNYCILVTLAFFKETLNKYGSKYLIINYKLKRYLSVSVNVALRKMFFVS